MLEMDVSLQRTMRISGWRTSTVVDHVYASGGSIEAARLTREQILATNDSVNVVAPMPQLDKIITGKPKKKEA
jgi:hypothetical protein